MGLANWRARLLAPLDACRLAGPVLRLVLSKVGAAVFSGPLSVFSTVVINHSQVESAVFPNKYNILENTN